MRRNTTIEISDDMSDSAGSVKTIPFRILQHEEARRPRSEHRAGRAAKGQDGLIELSVLEETMR